MKYLKIIFISCCILSLSCTSGALKDQLSYFDDNYVGCFSINEHNGSVTLDNNCIGFTFTYPDYVIWLRDNWLDNGRYMSVFAVLNPEQNQKALITLRAYPKSLYNEQSIIDIMYNILQIEKVTERQSENSQAIRSMKLYSDCKECLNAATIFENNKFLFFVMLTTNNHHDIFERLFVEIEKSIQIYNVQDI